MFCTETFYSKIEEIHDKTLKVIYGIDIPTATFVLCSSSVSDHQKQFRFLVIEIFKSISQINPDFMWLLFKQIKLSYN